LPRRRFSDYVRNAPTKSKSKAQDPGPELQKVKPKGFGVSEGGGAEYTASPYDFAAIDKLVDVDGYGKRSINRMIHLAFKEGWDLKSSNPEAVAYIRARFAMMKFTQNQSVEDLLIEIYRNALKYHNNFLIKTRDERPGQLFGMNLVSVYGKPVAGYICAPITTMSIKTDKNNVRIEGFKQTSGSNEAKFKVDEVIHLSIDRESGTFWGKPFLTSVLEDMRSFRIAEEDMLNLLHKEMYPTYYYKVGDAMHPADQDDLNSAVQALEDMYEDGAIAMPGKDEIGVVGSDGKALDVTPHIKHFKERAIVGLGVSPHQIGVGSDLNKAGAEQLDKALYDLVKFYQSKVETMVNDQIITELLLEGGYDPLGISGKESDMVTIEFKEVDIEAQIARENHVVTEFTQNAITHGEMRKKLGEPVDPRLQDKYFYDIQMEIAQAQAAATAAASPNQPAKGQAGSKDKPSNQHGNKNNPKVKA
jgi:hypothetical protein